MTPDTVSLAFTHQRFKVCEKKKKKVEDK